MKHPKLWDGISSVLVLFGLGLYGSSCYYGIWALIYVALGVHRAGRGHCRAHTALPVLPSLPRHEKTYCPHCGSDVRAGRNV